MLDGTLYAGRFASIASDSGSIGYLTDVSAFPNGFGVVGTQKGSTGSAYARYDNALAYQTPTFGGLQAAAMYSFKANSQTDKTSRENSSFADRYAAAGLRYKAGKAAVVLAGDYTLYSNSTHAGLDNGYSVILGGNYDFGVAKAFAKVTYFDNQVNVLDSFDLISDSRDLKKAEALKGWGAELGTNVPAFGGNFLAAVGYRDAKDVDDGSSKFEALERGCRLHLCLQQAHQRLRSRWLRSGKGECSRPQGERCPGRFRPRPQVLIS